MRSLKYSALVIVSVALIGGLGILYLTQWMSPNRLKPALIEAFRDAGVTIEIPSDLAWSLGQPMTISTGSVTLRSEIGALSAEKLTAQVDVWAFIAGPIRIHHLDLDRPSIRLSPNTDELMSTEPSRRIILSGLTLTDGRLDGLPGNTLLTRLNLNVDALLPDQDSELTLDAIAENAQLRFPLSIQTSVRPTLGFESLSFGNTRIQSRQAELSLEGYLTLATNGDIAGEGWIEIPPMHLRQWLSIAGVDLPSDPSQQSFRDFSLQGAFQVDRDGVRFEPLQGRLDESPWSAQATWLLAPGFWNTVVDLEHLDWPVAPVPEGQLKSPLVSLPLPPGNYSIRLKSLTAGSQIAERAQVTFGVDGDQVTIGQLRAQLYFGELEASGTWVPATGAMQWVGTYAEGSLAAMPVHAQMPGLAGQISLQFNLEMTTGTGFDLLETLTGNARLNLHTGALGPLSPATVLCQSSGPLIRSTQRFRDQLSLQSQIQNGVATLRQMSGELGGLTVSGEGRLSLLSGAMQSSWQTTLPHHGNTDQCSFLPTDGPTVLELNCRINLRTGQSECVMDPASKAALRARSTPTDVGASSAP